MALSIRDKQASLAGAIQECKYQIETMDGLLEHNDRVFEDFPDMHKLNVATLTGLKEGATKRLKLYQEHLQDLYEADHED